jgi:nitrogen fixation NifU-like protein
VDEALQIKNTEIVNELSLPPVKIHCSVLARTPSRRLLTTTRRSKRPIRSSN